MDLNQINAYLERACEIIGDRSTNEAAYDDAVVEHLNGGMDIRQAIRAANREHPNEALQPQSSDWTDVAARYEFLMQHTAILKRLGIRESGEPSGAANGGSTTSSRTGFVAGRRRPRR